MEIMLQRELNGISSASDKKSNRIRLCRHDTPCCESSCGLRLRVVLIIVFYVGLLPPLDPLKMVDHLLRRIQRTAKCPFKSVLSTLNITSMLMLMIRFVSRVIPISATNTATIKNLQSISEPTIKSGFDTPDNTPLKVSLSFLYWGATSSG
jgi:tRNA acetyltransferase TAN1